jgi:DNA-binding NarL/FixJ family response regulator
MRLTREAPSFGERELELLRRLRPLLPVAEARFDARPLAPEVLASLTPRQCAVVQYVARGLTNAEIARALRVSANTVRNSLADAFARLGVSTRAELVAVSLGHIV